MSVTKELINAPLFLGDPTASFGSLKNYQLDGMYSWFTKLKEVNGNENGSTTVEACLHSRCALSGGHIRFQPSVLNLKF